MFSCDVAPVGSVSSNLLCSCTKFGTSLSQVKGWVWGVHYVLTSTHSTRPRVYNLLHCDPVALFTSQVLFRAPPHHRENIPPTKHSLQMLGWALLYQQVLLLGPSLRNSVTFYHTCSIFFPTVTLHIRSNSTNVYWLAFLCTNT